jgi:hypothetical protein
MSRGQVLFVHLANLTVSGSGLVYAWMRYLAKPADEWAVVNHPWQPHLQHLHVLSAPLLVFAVGLIWSAHVVGKIRNGPTNRTAGIGLTALFLPMAAAGYLLQVSVDPGWRRIWMWVHVVSSLLWVAAFLVHQMRAVTTKERSEKIVASALPVVAPFQVTSVSGTDVSQPTDSSVRIPSADTS